LLHYNSGVTFAIKLTHDEPRLVYLALVYHLGRPGSELDPATRAPSEHGLRGIETALAGDVAADSAIVELDDEQFRKLLSAVYGSVNELRVHHMRGGVASSVPRFTETALTLFPALADDPEAALQLSEAMMMLHRRLERAVRRASEQQPPESGGRRSRWPFRR
jgi:hypothetical protein